jgi:hypothetical protein
VWPWERAGYAGLGLLLLLLVFNIACVWRGGSARQPPPPLPYPVPTHLPPLPSRPPSPIVEVPSYMWARKLDAAPLRTVFPPSSSPPCSYTPRVPPIPFPRRHTQLCARRVRARCRVRGWSACVHSLVCGLCASLPCPPPAVCSAVVVFGMVPCIAAWGMDVFQASYTAMVQLGPAPDFTALVREVEAQGTLVSGFLALSSGYQLVSLFWSASLLYLIEREYLLVRACTAWVEDPLSALTHAMVPSRALPPGQQSLLPFGAPTLPTSSSSHCRLPSG